jgi:C-terminal processing protease CtpA/Prc
MPIVALVNDYSLSCGEILPQAIRAIPGGRGSLVGTRTFGASGARADGSDQAHPFSLITNSGSFTGQAGGGASALQWYVIEAGIDSVDQNFIHHEGEGLVPDVIVPFSNSAFRGLDGATPTDAQLKAAIDKIKNQAG